MNVDRNFINLEIRGTKESISLQGDRNPFESLFVAVIIFIYYTYFTLII